MSSSDNDYMLEVQSATVTDTYTIALCKAKNNTSREKLCAFSGANNDSVMVMFPKGSTLNSGDTYFIRGNLKHINLPTADTFIAPKASIPSYIYNANDVESLRLSAIIPYVKKDTIDRLLDIHKSNAMNAVFKDPNITSILNDRELSQLRRGIGASKDARIAFNVLKKAGFDSDHCQSVLEHAKNCKIDPLHLLSKKPYRLLEVADIDFQMADSLALAVGVPNLCQMRMHKCAEFALEQAKERSHLYLTSQQFSSYLEKNLHIPKRDMDSHILKLVKDKVIAVYKNDDAKSWNISLFKDRESDLAIVKEMKRIAFATPRMTFQPRDAARLDNFLENYKIDGKYPLNKGQKEGVKVLLGAKNTNNTSPNVNILLGGAGTGKTTVLEAFKKASELLYGRSIIIGGAPTGKAAKRMGESLQGVNTQTVHKLLGAQGDGSFKRGSNYKLNADVILIDESSMLDLEVARKLLEATPSGAKVILIGDAGQLPSVGAGRFLGDLVDSNAVAKTELTETNRFKGRVLTAATDIRNGIKPDISVEIGGDFNFIQSDKSKLQSQCIGVVKKFIRNYGASPSDIQVLSPVNEGDLGVNELNKLLQPVLNEDYHASGTRVKNFGEWLMKGDRIVITANNNKKKVYNGDEGIVIEATSDHTGKHIKMNVDGEIVTFEGKELATIKLGYARTIHKSQGSEYPNVVMPVPNGNTMSRELFYTGVTRTKRRCVILGDETCFDGMMKSNDVNTSLKSLVKDALTNSNDKVQYHKAFTAEDNMHKANVASAEKPTDARKDRSEVNDSPRVAASVAKNQATFSPM